jgi:hypothetical protein
MLNHFAFICTGMGLEKLHNFRGCGNTCFAGTSECKAETLSLEHNRRFLNKWRNVHVYERIRVIYSKPGLKTLQMALSKA